MNAMQIALVKKDLWSVTSNKRLFPVLLLVPIILTLVLPTIFVLSIHFAPEELGDFQNMLRLLPGVGEPIDLQRLVLDLVLNRVMPMFFLMIPIMAASVMAASAFVGEKEKRTLETLLYCPLTLKQIFEAKILASFAMSMAVSFASFASMMLVIEVEIVLTTGSMLIPNIGWLITMLLVSPSISLIAITFIVRGSAKAQTMEEAQQRAVFLILPILILVVGQFTGIILISPWLLLGVGAVVALLAWLLIKGSMSRFNYEMLLK
ncbi:MAG TPA: ABC transporter permease [Clostridia bacterium]|nr:ABC transporter permease [Clostridia bacterium]